MLGLALLEDKKTVLIQNNQNVRQLEEEDSSRFVGGDEDMSFGQARPGVRSIGSAIIRSVFSGFQRRKLPLSTSA